MIEIDICKK